MNTNNKPNVGDNIEVWFDGGIVLAVWKYHGRYQEYFKWVVRVTATNTRNGWLEMVI
jgi:hypothetical protein